MTRQIEESWIDNGLIENLRMRYILRKVGILNDLIFIAQLEYTNRTIKNNVIIRWDAAHNTYHRDVFDKSGTPIEKYNYEDHVPMVEKQVDIVFNDLRSNLGTIFKDKHTDILNRINIEKQSYLNRLNDIEKEIYDQVSNKKGLLLSVRHWFQNISAKANIVHIEDTMEYELYDSEGNLKQKGSSKSN